MCGGHATILSVVSFEDFAFCVWMEMCSDRRKMAGLDPTRFDDLLRGVFDDEQRETIRMNLDTIRSVGQLRNIVAGANRIEATTLLQNSLIGLSYQDAAVLAGLVLPQGSPFSSSSSQSSQ
jgi:hypothetical protein